MARSGLLVAMLGLARSASSPERCLTDTFGMAGESYSRPFEKGVEDFHCTFRYTDAAKRERFVLNYYPSAQDFADYRGTDMVPERHVEYDWNGRLYEGLEKWVPGRNGPKAQTKRIQLASCELPQSDGSTYSIQRVGPLVSTGNYDYWQFGWHDLWDLSDRVSAHPRGLMFDSSFSGPVDKSGHILGHPPIHIHHIHITPMPGVVTKMSGGKCLDGSKPKECYVAKLVVEQHGDYQCSEQDGGMDCFFERTADGHAKVLTSPLDLEGEINDVRAPDSEPMTWWYQIVLHWFPFTETRKPLSQHFTVGPGNYITGDQRTAVLVFPVDTKEKSMYWYTGTMLHDGELTRNKLHAHNTMFQSAFFFSGTPEDVGLDDHRFWPKKSFEPLLLKDLGYPDFGPLEQYLLGNLRDAIERWDVACPPSEPSCAQGRPGIICESWVSNHDFVDPRSGRVFAYDRRAPCCCKPWHFKQDGPFTVVAFLHPLKTPPGPWMPDKIPPTANMHIHWLMTYHALDNISHYSLAVYSQNPAKELRYPDDLSRYPVWQILGNRFFGTNGSHNMTLSVWQKLIVTLAWLRLSLTPLMADVKGLILLLLLCFMLCSVHVVQKCRRAKHVQEHPVVQCVQQAPCGLAVDAEAAAVDCLRSVELAPKGD